MSVPCYRRTLLVLQVGISPQHRVAAYSALPEADQKSLKTKLEEYGKSYGLRDFTFRSFFKVIRAGWPPVFTLSVASPGGC